MRTIRYEIMARRYRNWSGVCPRDQPSNALVTPHFAQLKGFWGKLQVSIRGSSTVTFRDEFLLLEKPVRFLALPAIAN